MNIYADYFKMLSHTKESREREREEKEKKKIEKLTLFAIIYKTSSAKYMPEFQSMALTLAEHHI